MSIRLIRNAIAANLTSIAGLRTSADIPDNPSPPIAVVALDNVEYDGAFAGGLTEYNFLITVLASRASERSGQTRLDGFTSTGTNSVKKAIESDKFLGGEAFDVRVTRMTNIGTVSLGEINYLAATFAVTVFAN